MNLGNFSAMESSVVFGVISWGIYVKKRINHTYVGCFFKAFKKIVKPRVDKNVDRYTYVSSEKIRPQCMLVCVFSSMLAIRSCFLKSILQKLTLVFAITFCKLSLLK